MCKLMNPIKLEASSDSLNHKQLYVPNHTLKFGVRIMCAVNISIGDRFMERRPKNLKDTK
jgi:hypothetical protein